MGLFRGDSGKMKSIAPVFGTTDVARWQAHYERLGFAVEVFGPDYAIATHEDVELHASLTPDHDPARTAACAYLHVGDANALWQRWSAVESGRNNEPAETDHGLLEGAHFDPDNNLIRYGSRL